MKITFEEFLQRFNKKDDFYIPKDPSLNYFRHFGQRTNEGLLLKYEELLYLFDKNIFPEDLRMRVYFELKNNGYNLLNTGKETKIYNKTKHFNRNTAEEIGSFSYVGGDELISFPDSADRNVFAVLGWGDYCLLDAQKVDIPSKEINEKLKKKSH